MDDFLLSGLESSSWNQFNVAMGEMEEMALHRHRHRIWSVLPTVLPPTAATHWRPRLAGCCQGT